MLSDLPDKPFLTAIETAQALGCTRQTLRNRIRNNTCVPPPVEGSKPPMWRRVDVAAAVGAA